MLNIWRIAPKENKFGTENNMLLNDEGSLADLPDLDADGRDDNEGTIRLGT